MAPPADRPAVIAHRGASHDHPEHTEAAYRAAIEAGADGVECDVRLSADRVPVCVHDGTVERTSSGRGRVSWMSLEALQELDWGSWRDGVPADLLTLARLLDLLEESARAGRRVELAIETKHPSRFGGRVEQAVVELLAARGLLGPEPPVRVMSFSLLALRRVQRLAPTVPVVLLTDRILPPLRDGALPAGVGIAGPGMHLVRERPDHVTALQQAGHAVHVWTVDEPDDIRRCLDLGVDAIITNRPDEVRRMVAAGAA